VKLSRKPRTMLVMLLIAVFLMSFSGVAMATQGVNWGTWLNYYSTGSSITGTVYEDQVGGNVYAVVYASIYGQTYNTPVNTVSQSIYGTGSSPVNFSVPLSSFSNLMIGQNYTVALKVYSGNSPQTINFGAFNSYTSPSFMLTGGGSVYSCNSDSSEPECYFR